MKTRPSILSAGVALGIILAVGPDDAHGQSPQDYASLAKRLQALESKTARLEAENRQLLDREIPTTPSSADKIKLSTGIAELSIYGDLRLRYQYDNADPQLFAVGAKGEEIDVHANQRSRWRYRLRLNADFKLGDNWFGGVGLQTGQSADSGFETYAGGFQNYNIYISRAFVGWNAADWLTIIAGKQANPFYTTELVWDSDINPTGITEQVRFHKLFGGETVEESVAGYSKDGKAIVTSSSSTIQSPWELTLIGGQFIFDDNLENSLDNDTQTDAYLFEQQLVASYKFSKNVKATFAPAFLLYNSANITVAGNQQPFTVGSSGLPNTGQTRDLHILQGPGDVSFKVFGQKTKFLWDVAYNLNGAARSQDIYGVQHSGQDDLAFLVGLQVGDNKKKGDWSAFVNYRQIGLSSVDPNLNDSDWAQSRVNVRGWKGGLAYNFTDSVVASVAYSTADNIRKNLYGGQATGGARLADINSAQTLQFDLNVKF